MRSGSLGGPDPSPCDERDTRGVSDVLAFVLVFSIIVTSVGLVYTFGMGALDDVQQSEQDRNAERAFEAIAATFEDLQTGRGEERMSEINPRGARLGLSDEPSITIDADGVTVAEDVGSLEYSNENTQVTYEFGAVLRADDGNSVMVRSPDLACRTSGVATNRSIVSYPNIEPKGPSGITSDGTTQITAEREGQRLRYPVNRTAEPLDNRSSATDVTIEIDDTDHADAWGRHFNESGDWTDVSASGDSVEATCEIGDDGVAYVRETELVVRIGFEDS